jgi:signal transduction histidine kinase
MRSYRNWWIVYGLCSCLLLLATSWITVTLLAFEAREAKLKATSAIQEDMRLALWRMDSHNDSLLAGESARAFFHYRAYYPHQRAYTRLLEAFGPDDLLVPSPLLEHESSIVLLHMQRQADGHWTSPEVPTGNLRDLAEASGIDGERIDAHAALLATIADSMDRSLTDATIIFGAQFAADTAADDTIAAVDFERPHQLLRKGEAQSATAEKSVAPFELAEREAELAERRAQLQLQSAYVDERSLLELEARGRWVENTQALAMKQQIGLGQTLASKVQEVDVTAFRPRWIETDHPMLLFTRDVTVGDVVHEQSFVVDFPMLAAELLKDVADLFPAAGLRPIMAGQTLANGEASRQLATLPVVLEVGRRPLPVTAGLSPMRMALLMAWLAVTAVIAAGGLTLRSIIAHATRRMRFASAVTHELRTPLTTFQLYSELLDEGLVKDEATQREYHSTLRRESSRLGRLVENVLAYARLEDGRHVTKRETLRASDLVERVVPTLRDRATASEMEFTAPDALDSSAREASLTTSPEVVEQILGNLVDNACKYGAAPVVLRVQITAEALVLDIEDAGSGVSADVAERIFEPFDRGHRQDGDPSAGVGLGLALSRELARDLGGSLTLCDGRPTAFRLQLPL